MPTITRDAKRARLAYAWAKSFVFVPVSGLGDAELVNLDSLAASQFNALLADEVL